MSETRRKWLTAVGYPAFFVLCFLFSLYLTFPIAMLKGVIVDEMTAQLNAAQSPGQYGKPGKVSAESVDVYRLTGVALKNLVILPVTTNPDPASPVELDFVAVRVNVLPLLLKRLVVSFNVEAYGGAVTGTVHVGGEGFRELQEVHGNAAGIQWGRIAAIKDRIKLPGEGAVGGSVDLTMGKEIKEATGTIKLSGEGLAVGPGELAVPGFGSLTLPRIDLGVLNGDIKVSEGKTQGPPITLTGNDFQGQLDAAAQLRKPLDASMVNNGVAMFKLSEEFLKANPRFQPVFDFTPQLKQARDEDNAYRFRLRGPLNNLSPRPDKTARVSAPNGPIGAK